MEIHLSDKERKDQQIARWTSIIVHTIIILLLFLPLLKFPIPPPGQEGILVSFGMPDQGQGDGKPMTQNEEKVDPTPPSKPTPPQPEEKEEVTKPTPAKAAEAAPPKTPDKKVITTEDPTTAALKKKQKEDAQKAADAEKAQKAADAATAKAAQDDARKKAAADAAQKKAEADAAAKEQADLENAKKQYGDVFGSGKGNTGKTGNQGDPNGDPNADNLKGISTGSGNVGGGLDGRGVKFEPQIQENSQKTGRVVVNVCVDGNGNVISAKYTQKGSTTTDATLRQIAEDSAKKFKFTASAIDQQCGTITIDFKVK
ncbi:MAG: energy transducer TonB [Saprospiraceae bacterium]